MRDTDRAGGPLSSGRLGVVLLAMIVGAVAVYASAGSAGASPEPAAQAAGRSKLPDFGNVSKKWNDKRDLTTKGDEPCPDNTDPYDLKKLNFKLKRGKVTITGAYYGKWKIDGQFWTEKGLDPDDPNRSLESQALNDFGVSMYPSTRKKALTREQAFSTLELARTTSYHNPAGGTTDYGTFLEAPTYDADGRFVSSLNLGKIKVKLNKQLDRITVTFPLDKLAPVIRKPNKLEALLVGVSTPCRTAAGDYIPGGTWARFGGTEGGTITAYGSAKLGVVKMAAKKGKKGKKGRNGKGRKGHGRGGKR